MVDDMSLFMMTFMMKSLRIVEMEDQLETIRRSKLALVEYLVSQMPSYCHCLNSLLQQLRSAKSADNNGDDDDEGNRYEELLTGAATGSSIKRT